MYMDERNLRDLNRKSKQIKNCKAKIELLWSYDPQNQHIFEYPSNGSEFNFETVYQQCMRCCRAFLEKACYSTPVPSCSPCVSPRGSAVRLQLFLHLK
ncbi:unnamed protein product [Nyctereutes procyonoides]|uniref:Low molecular weight phosphotyrosine protein phosphatase n=1 Tax=Nyctereutes procyonoides TaxID=34880 RepID=A0A811YQT2_NYCPR|nr:unnamed protein product [Nyctereutes procyonoides]